MTDIVGKVDSWIDRHETAIEVAQPLVLGGLASALLLSMDPSKLDDPQSKEVLIAFQEAIRNQLEFLIAVVTNPFIIAMFLAIVVMIIQLSRGDK